jgi:hypothetical protein
MMAFALPPLILVTLVALLTSAKANWAAPSAVSMTILAVALMVRRRQWRWLQASVALGIIFQLILVVTDAFADRVTVPFLPQPDIYRRTMGWKDLSRDVRQIALSNDVQTIAADQNAVVASLLYYLREDKWPIFAWPTGALPQNQFELDRPLTSAAAEPVLFLSDRFLPDRLAEYYSTVETLPPIEAVSGPRSTRRDFAFRLSGARRDLAPLTPGTH